MSYLISDENVRRGKRQKTLSVFELQNASSKQSNPSGSLGVGFRIMMVKNYPESFVDGR